MSDPDLVSIVVPVYQTASYLEQCVRSLSGQTYSNVEIILVDDGSTDGSGETCDRLARSDGRIVVHHQSNAGLSAARNRGVSLATGDWTLFVDSDDWIHADLIRSCLAAVTPTVDMVASDFSRVSDRGSVLSASGNGITYLSGDECLRLLMGPRHTLLTVSWGKLMRTSIARSTPFPPGRLHEDEWTTYKMIAAARDVAIVERDLYYYYQNPSGISGKGLTPRHAEDIAAAYAERRDFLAAERADDLTQQAEVQLFKKQQQLARVYLQHGDRTRAREATRLARTTAARVRLAAPHRIEAVTVRAWSRASWAYPAMANVRRRWHSPRIPRRERHAQPEAGGVIIYRGQIGLERSRIEFLIDSAIRAYGPIEVIHLSPMDRPDKEWEQILATRPDVKAVHRVRAGLRDVIPARRAVRSVLRSRTLLLAIGFSSAAFLPPGVALLWSVNGIPEERLMTEDSPRSRLSVRLAWRRARRVHAERIIVVSEPMAHLVTERIPGAEAVVVPNTVATETFSTANAGMERSFLTYLGGGAPWQGLERLSLVWAEIFTIDPSTRFRVISRDMRTRILSAGLPPHAVEFLASDDAGDIATWLAEAKLGFLFREPSLVNRVSWPMKFGEYVAAGVPVAVSRCGWDIERLVERYHAGVVLRWEDDVRATAHTIVSYLDTLDRTPQRGVDQAADYLDGAHWQAQVASTLRRAMHRD